MIGVFDSGVGGLTVLRELRRRLPRAAFLYFGDTARVPYGGKSPATVRRFAREDSLFLLHRGARMIVAACHTASALAGESLRRELRVPALDVLQASVSGALRATRGGPIGVIATASTVRSGAHERLLRAASPGISVVARACPLLVPLIEEGWLHEPETRAILRRYLAPLREAEVDTLVLACTHYPFLRDAIAREMGHDVMLVDPATVVAEEAAEMVARDPALGEEVAGAGRLELWASDVPSKFEEMSTLCLGEPMRAREVGLDELTAQRPHDRIAVSAERE